MADGATPGLVRGAFSSVFTQRTTSSDSRLRKEHLCGRSALLSRHLDGLIVHNLHHMLSLQVT